MYGTSTFSYFFFTSTLHYTTSCNVILIVVAPCVVVVVSVRLDALYDQLVPLTVCCCCCFSETRRLYDQLVPLTVCCSCCCFSEARRLYDQLVPLCPIMLALTASSPAHRGYLVDTDCRWNIISQSADDRHDTTS